MVPETPGWYWVSRGRSSHLVFVYQMPGLPCEVREPFGGRDGTQWRTVKDCAEALGWVWGERIPDSPTLKAMRLVLSTIEARDDSPRTSGCGKPARCIFCASTQIPTGTGCSSSYVLEHAADCPWLRAQEKADAESPG